MNDKSLEFYDLFRSGYEFFGDWEEKRENKRPAGNFQLKLNFCDRHTRVFMARKGNVLESRCVLGYVSDTSDCQDKKIFFIEAVPQDDASHLQIIRYLGKIKVVNGGLVACGEYNIKSSERRGTWSMGSGILYRRHLWLLDKREKSKQFL